MGDNPKTTQSEAKKAPKESAGHGSDSDESVGDIECTTCGVSFSSGTAYEAHMQGKKHQKKVNEAKLAAKNSAGDDDKKEASGDDDDDDSNDMYCEVCDKRFSGYISYAAHIKGRVHEKNVKKLKLMQKQGNMPDVMDDKSGDDEDELLPKPYAKCNACQKEFSGPEPYEMHVRSAVHKKKVKQSQALVNLKAKYEDETNNSDGEEFFSKCDVCQKSFSGVVPYKTHMESGVHKKNLEKKKVAEEIKEFHDGESSYVCRECKKSFSDPLAFKCHLEKNSHEKQKAKSALREFLKPHPEIICVYPYRDDEDENESDSDNPDSNYYLICKLCKVSFSGPESAQDHVKSSKHLNAKKEKELLKKQKKNSKPKSNDKASNDINHSSEKIPNGKPKSPENSHADGFELI